MSELKINDKVNYHCIAGGDVSSTGHIIRLLEPQPNNFGGDVAWITDKSSCVSLDHLSKVIDEMQCSEALQEIIKIIQTKDNYIEEYELMLIKFMDSQEDGDTVRMSFEFAKQEINQ